jgi:hypothetical protein
MNRKTLIFSATALLSGIFLTAMSSNSLHAQEDNMVNVMFPSRFTLQKHIFDPAPVLIKVDDGAAKKIAFNIPIPSKEWQRMPVKEFSSGARTLAGFIHPNSPDQGMIQVMAYRPPYEMAPGDWLLYTLEQENMKVITSAGDGIDGPGPFFEVLAVSQLPEKSSQEPIMMRAAVFRYGETFVLVRCMASSKSYLELADCFGVTIHRFEFQNILLPVLIGQWEKHCIDTYCFTGPESGFAPVASSREAVVEQSLPLYLEGIRTGLLNIKIVHSPLAEQTPAQTRINNILYSMVEKSGMSFDKDLVALKGEHKNLGGTAYYAHNLGLGADKTAIEFFALSWEGEGSAVLIYMLTDAREKNPIAWMVNKRTFEIISQSFSHKVQ